MEDKEKFIPNDDNLNKREEPVQHDVEDQFQTKRHYYSFGGKVNGQTSEHELKMPALDEVANAAPGKAFDPHVNKTASISEQSVHNWQEDVNRVEYTEPYTEGSSLNTMTLNKVEQASSNRDFKVSEKKSSKLKTVSQYFMMFIASVLVVGGFMFVADKQNWFTGQTNATVSQSTNKDNASQSTSTVQSPYLEDRPDNISELFSAASPAVVKIETYSEVNYSNSNSLFNDPFFRQFFGDSYVPRQQTNEGKSELQQSGMGTGFFFDEDGYILTNQHVIGDAKEIRVIVEGYEEPFIAELLGSSFDLDLAVLKLDEDIKFPTLEIGSSEDIKIGDWVVAIGNPYGFDHTLTVGVISAKERPISISDEDGERNYKNLLQTDASINPGNSGGPLLNLNGQVIGINTAVSSQAQGIGFAIPTSTINEVLDYLKNNEEIPAEPVPFIGIRMSTLTEEMIQGTGLTKPEGVRVESIYYGTPAYNSGLNQYDIITKIDDTVITKREDLSNYVSSKQVGDIVKMHIIRLGKEMVISVEIGDQNNYQINQ